MKNIIRGVIILSLLFIGYYFHTTHQQLVHIIHQQQDHINSLYIKKNLNDSICKNVWEYIPFGSPVECIIMSSKFGLRKDPFSRRWKRHNGIDLKGPRKDTIYAAGGGYVTIANFHGGFGRCVIIDHGQGYQTTYAHLSKILIKEGEFVRDKQPIGKMGSSGYSTGTHLHYEITKDCIPIDPKKYIFMDL